MKGFFKQNKGFSLVELLIALLIMAIIAGTAITLFGGVLDTSKGGADRETADAIKRAILTYMNASNDTDLSAMGIAEYDKSSGKVTTSGTAQQLVNYLSGTVTIDSTAAKVEGDFDDNGTADTVNGKKNNEDLVGTYGPFLESTLTKPTQEGFSGWDIAIDIKTQVVTVTSMKPDGTSNDKLVITPN
jgi:type IV pilus assembly protein PilA